LQSCWAYAGGAMPVIAIGAKLGSLANWHKT
jgi:hypothetical protein